MENILWNVSASSIRRFETANQKWCIKSSDLLKFLK